ncbi:hypothetical protein [Chitinophaga sp. GbtcB8]|uniref:hypothetical protein n=1 Tax=Chitinophaga sp. GbtcB8 TaxID=2824753 RepID=UPI001C30BEEA|nr:hypothetical protein [Chitinophaga sp. GbtcB8]
MKTHLLLRILLAFHLTGLTIMAGTSIIDFFTFKTFCRLIDHSDNKALSLLPLMSGYGSFVRAGAAILILTGAGMFLMMKGIWWDQLWFKIKIALALLLVLNGILVGNKQGTRLRSMAYEGFPDFVQRTVHIRASLDRFYITQLLLFFLIILVSAIKFEK